MIMAQVALDLYRGKKHYLKKLNKHALSKSTFKTHFSVRLLLVTAFYSLQNLVDHLSRLVSIALFWLKIYIIYFNDDFFFS